MDKQFKIGDKLSPDDIEVGMIVDLLPYSHTHSFYSFKDIVVTDTLHDGFNFKHRDTLFFIGNLTNYLIVFKGMASVKEDTTNTQPQSKLSEQSIVEAIKTCHKPHRSFPRMFQ